LAKVKVIFKTETITLMKQQRIKYTIHTPFLWNSSNALFKKNLANLKSGTWYSVIFELGLRIDFLLKFSETGFKGLILSLRNRTNQEFNTFRFTYFTVLNSYTEEIT